MRLLHIDSSILGEMSVSRQLSAAIVEQLRREIPDLAITYRDLAAAPLAHLTGAHFMARMAKDSSHGAELAGDLAASEEALAEFLAADIVVVGAPMYNFGVSSQLKAWIDRLAVAGRTFRYTETGPVGLAGGKRVIVASSRGNFYGPGAPAAAADHQETYLRSIFAFFGVTDLTYVRAEGVAISAEKRQAAIAQALRNIAGGFPVRKAA